MSKPVPELIVVKSDLHAGSTVAVCPPEGTRTDDGQEVKPSPLQKWIWERYERFYQRALAVKKSLKGCRVTVVGNGDMFEGNHHGTQQVMAPGKDAQAYIASRLFDPVEALQPDRLYIVRGTEVHVGPSGSDEEALAKTLSARLPVVRDPVTHLWSYWHLRLLVNDTLLDFQHHTNVGGLPWTAPGAIARLAFRIWVEHTERGWRPPDLAIRSHRHQYRDSYGAHKTRAIVTPAWQAKTAFGHKVVPESIADMGGLLITIPPAGPYHVEPVLFPPDEPTPLRS